MQLLQWVTDSTALSPHGFCLLWDPTLLWLDALSDGVIMLAYFSIPLAVLWFLRGRPDLPHRWIAALFAAFIVACGITHGFDVLTLWLPAYRLEAVAKLATACLSLITAVVLWPLVPKLLALPSAAQVAGLNEALRNTIAGQRQTELRLRDSEQRLLRAQETLQRGKDALEQRVAERTAELMRLNLAIARSEMRVRRVVEAAPTAMIMVSASGRIEMVNPQAERMFGYESAELVGSPVEMLVPEASRAAHPGLRAGFVADPQPRPMAAGMTLFGLRKDRSQFEVEIGLSPIETEEGAMVLSAITDISARVQMEAQLRQSQKMDAIGRVTAGVAHDFNNLLQALGGSLEMLLDAIADRPAAMEWAQVAQRAAGRGGELTGRLLAFSRQQVLTTRAVPVRTLLTEVGELISHLFETKANERNELTIEPGPEELAVFADRAQLEAALLNLAVNARDAMPSGGRLCITARSAEGEPDIVAPGRYIVISVADTGIGMDEATLAKACEPFFTTKGQNGTGLGLSMVHGFARQSGGEARILSVVGAGTTIELWLPAASTAAAEEPVSNADSGTRTVRGRVLLVDDSSDVLLIVSSFLRQAGLDVTAAASGDLALAVMLAGQRYDLVVTDVAMPGLNGIDLLVQAREIDPALPGIIISGFHDPDILSGVGNVAVLRKPFSREALIEQVLILLGRPAASVSGGTGEAAAPH